jgi:hypothetical protein
VYGLARTTPQGSAGSINLFSAAAIGGPVRQLTYDGVSLYPVWGARGIVFDKETPGRRGGVPGYQFYLLDRGHVTQITHMNVYWLNEGLAPAAVSADGTGSPPTWKARPATLPKHGTLNLATGTLHNIGTWLVAHGISSDGRRMLLDKFEIPPWPSKRTTSKRSRSPAARPGSS